MRTYEVTMGFRLSDNTHSQKSLKVEAKSHPAAKKEAERQLKEMHGDDVKVVRTESHLQHGGPFSMSASWTT